MITKSKCYLHPSEAAIGKCSVCNRPVCKKCSTSHSGKLICRNTSHHRSLNVVDTDEVERQERLERKRDEERKGRTR